MRFNLAAAVLSTAALVAASPFEFPLGNGFPAPDDSALSTIEGHAGGAIPNGALPTKMKQAGITSFQLIALNEIFEVAFFTELLKNVTDGVPGYKVEKQHYIKRVVRRIRAQEELHALGANGILKSVGAPTIGGLCKYEFPVTDFESALALAETFTAIVLAIVPEVQAVFAEDGGQEPGLIPLVGSIIAQEGEQTGWFRAYQGKAPSAAPFLTGGPAQFAASAISMFIVPGSCDEDLKTIGIPILDALTVTKAPVKPVQQTISFSVEGTVSEAMDSITYLSGQSLPITVPISNVKTMDGTTSFDAEFPYIKGGMAKGLTFAAVTSGAKSFDTPADVAAAASYGPGLIILQ